MSGTLMNLIMQQDPHKPAFGVEQVLFLNYLSHFAVIRLIAEHPDETSARAAAARADPEITAEARYVEALNAYAVHARRNDGKAELIRRQDVEPNAFTSVAEGATRLYAAVAVWNDVAMPYDIYTHASAVTGLAAVDVSEASHQPQRSHGEANLNEEGARILIPLELKKWTVRNVDRLNGVPTAIVRLLYPEGVPENRRRIPGDDCFDLA